MESIEAKIEYAAQRLGSTLLFQALHGDLLERARIMGDEDYSKQTTEKGFLGSDEHLYMLLALAIAIIAKKEGE